MQILELPEGAGDDRPPFILVVDGYTRQRYILGPDQPDPIDEFDGIAEKIGARAVLVFEDTIDIPANDTSGYLRDAVESGAETERDEMHAELGLAPGQLHSAALSAIRGKHANIHELIGRAEHAEIERDEARLWARHGYEIGQKHCGWSDHGVAPAWLTEGWPPHIDSCEHLKQAVEYDEALTRVRAEVVRIRGITPTWGPVADLIEAALNGDQQPAERVDIASEQAGEIAPRQQGLR
ncbi:hypothetical protein [Streptomyces sp. EN16]|uniref:hypothetical protein n=1 Tax=Streptomyces sp. EN16 TaxID=212773 RepID=UPI001C403072|nr:hypothetical protein [Streptomyces sp. EN16]